MTHCHLRFSKIQKALKRVLDQEIAMNVGRAGRVFEKHFPEAISLIFKIYFLSAQNVKSFRSKKHLFFSVLLFFNAYELAKSLFNGVVNSNRIRFYLLDFICTLQSNQILFNFSFAITYVYTIRLALKLLLGYNNNDVLNPDYCKFLEADTERELVEHHSFTSRDARDYFKLVKFMAKFIVHNLALFTIGSWPFDVSH